MLLIGMSGQQGCCANSSDANVLYYKSMKHQIDISLRCFSVSVDRDV